MTRQRGAAVYRGTNSDHTLLKTAALPGIFLFNRDTVYLLTMKYLAITGRQPAIALAELESLFSARAIHPLPGGAALIDTENENLFYRLGSVIKVSKILTTLETTDWFAIEKYLISACKKNEQYVPDGKLTIGLSVYGIDVSPKMLERTALNIKKAVKSTGRPVRIVPNKTREISTPQIIHNDLTGPNGWELVLYRDGRKTILAQTVFIQDIEGYTARDQKRPMRDTRVGMLPPKLAQTIINLAHPEASTIDTVILDPFCGTGVLMQEALLMGYSVSGTDIEPRMIEYTSKNLEWLKNSFGFPGSIIQLEKGDAISHSWKDITSVACEGYLGLPFSHLPSDSQLQESIQTSNQIAKGFLKNIYTQVPSGFRLCIGLPAWHVKNKTIHLPLLGNIESSGWKRIEFKHAKTADLIYHRDDQIVGRELAVLVKK